MLRHERLLRLCQARDALRDVQRTQATVADIAASVAMSQFHFIRQFRALLGETHQQYRTRARLERATHLLVHGGATLTEVCMAVGFTSLGSFSALFARRFGEAPAAYRRRLAGDRQALTPDCVGLMTAAWRGEAQFSRSRDPDE